MRFSSLRVMGPHGPTLSSMCGKKPHLAKIKILKIHLCICLGTCVLDTFNNNNDTSNDDDNVDNDTTG